MSRQDLSAIYSEEPSVERSCGRAAAGRHVFASLPCHPVGSNGLRFVCDVVLHITLMASPAAVGSGSVRWATTSLNDWDSQAATRVLEPPRHRAGSNGD